MLVLTTFDDDDTLAATLRAGAAGSVLKSAPGEDILRAIATVAAAGARIDPHAAGRVLDSYRDHTPRAPIDLSVLTEPIAGSEAHHADPQEHMSTAQ